MGDCQRTSEQPQTAEGEDSMSTALATTGTLPEQVLEMIVASGDLGKLTAAQRTQYLLALCESIGLNPLSRPIEFVNLNGKVVPYFKKDGTDQLRQLRKISITIVGREVVDGVMTVTARASTPDGRCDEDFGSVVIANLKGEQAANATMKCITKAKRRVTLSICGLGFTDESELETIPGARVLASVDEPATVVSIARHIAPAATEEAGDTVASWSDRLRSAEDIDELEVIRASCKQVVTDQAQLLELGAVYAARKRELQAPQAVAQ